MCFRCCDSNSHMATTCNEKIKCEECGSTRHISAMHIDGYIPKHIQDSKPNRNIGGEGETFNKELQNSSITSKCTQVCGKTFNGKSDMSISKVKATTLVCALYICSYQLLIRISVFTFTLILEKKQNKNNDSRTKMATSAAAASTILFLSTPAFQPFVTGEEICASLGPVVNHIEAIIPKGRDTWEVHITDTDVATGLELTGVRVRGFPLVTSNLMVETIFKNFGEIVAGPSVPTTPRGAGPPSRRVTAP